MRIMTNDNPITDDPFALDIPIVASADPSAAESREERILGMRPAREVVWRRFREMEKKIDKQAGLIKDLVNLAEHFDQVLRTFKESKALAWQQEAMEYIVNLRATLHDVLEKQNVFQVPIEGCTYDHVVFKGVAIPQPWSVVDRLAADAEQEGGNARDKAGRTVKRVVRSLWVHFAFGELTILQRGQVFY